MAGRLKRKYFLAGLLVVVGLGYTLACASSSNSTGGVDNAGPGADFSAGVGGSGANAGNSFVAATGGTSLPPETKVTLAVEVPQASQNYVYAANPDRDSVAVINPINLSIQTVAVDSAPHGLKTIPNQDSAIVVNTGSSTVSVLRTDASGTVATTKQVMSGSNVVSVAPNGGYAVVYYDSSQPTDGPPTDSPQNMSVVQP